MPQAPGKRFWEVDKVQQSMDGAWQQKAAAAIKSGDFDAYRDANVNLRVGQTIGLASREGWSSWKTRSVCKYITKVFQNMAVVELVMIDDQAVQELITHVSEGFDAHARRRAARN